MLVQYARFSPGLSKDVLKQLLFDTWKLSQPNFLISIIARDVPSCVAASVSRVRIIDFILLVVMLFRTLLVGFTRNSTREVEEHARRYNVCRAQRVDGRG